MNTEQKHKKDIQLNRLTYKHKKKIHANRRIKGRQISLITNKEI